MDLVHPQTEAEEASAFRTLIASKLRTLFQPIFSLPDLTVYGWEALIRGPAGSDLERPDALFGTARRFGLLHELDYACRKTAIETFAGHAHAIKRGRRGFLFLNVDPLALIQSAQSGRTLQFLHEVGIPAASVVIELTEATPGVDYADLAMAAQHYRSQGFRIAIDDLGEGFSSLRLWAELRPDFVKIDRHFVQSAVMDGSSRRFLEAIASLAVSTGSKIVAEGIEGQETLTLVQQLGIHCAQGYLLGRPTSGLATRADCEPILRKPPGRSSSRPRARILARPVAGVAAETPCEAVYERFANDPACRAIPVLDAARRPVGLILREAFMEEFARPYRRELFAHKACVVFKGGEMLTIDAELPIEELVRNIQSMPLETLSKPFVILEEGKYLGLGDGQLLLKELVEIQVQAARYASPLTNLPGNIPIQQTIDEWIQEHIHFVVAYVDLSHFKAYNDTYGFMRGDELIRLVASLLQEHSDPHQDFVGHIGGDDFIVLWRDPAWQERVASLFAAYERALPTFYSAKDWERGGIEAEDRQGRMIWHPVCALAIGALVVYPGKFCSHREVGDAAATVKKMAKKRSLEFAEQGKRPANALFLDRRDTGAPSHNPSPKSW